MCVLVTGHRGCTGVVLTRLLLREGYEVVGYDADLRVQPRAEEPTPPQLVKSG